MARKSKAGCTGRRKRAGAVLMTMSFLLIALMLLSFLWGRYAMSPEAFAQALGKLLQGKTDGAEAAVLWRIRLPRIVLACMVGASLALAGAAYQGVFQNPMASPDLLGASNGAAFGAALAILMGGSRLLLTMSAFFFSLLTVLIVYQVGRRVPGKRTVNLVLSGLMISSLFSAATSYLKLVADPADELPAITYWMLGSLSGARLSDVAMAALPMALGWIPLLLLRWKINLLTLDEDEARSVGLRTDGLRLIVVLCATLVTAASVAVSGMIGWVGLVIPHLSRKLVGCDFRVQLPCAFLFGALFMLLTDNVSRNLLAVEIPIGILTAVIGAPFFLYLMFREGGGAV